MVDRLRLDLGYLVAQQRMKIKERRSSKAYASMEIDRLLEAYFGSLPPDNFFFNGRWLTPVAFARHYGQVESNLTQLQVVELPDSMSRKVQRRLQAVIAEQLKREKKPILIKLRWIDAFTDGGILSVDRFSHLQWDHEFANLLVHDKIGINHLVLLTGYSRLKNGDYVFEIQNSWGEHWGQGGKGYIDPSYWPFVRDVALYPEYVKLLKKEGIGVPSAE